MISKKISKNLEYYRGLAAFLVVLVHVNQWYVIPFFGVEHASVAVAQNVGHFSVLIFFALSGYVISHSLTSNFQRNGYIDAASYCESRLIRILPPAVFAVALSIFIALLIMFFNMHGSVSFRLPGDLYVARERIDLDLLDVVSTMLISNGVIPGTKAISTNGPLWSLSLEFWAYFLALMVAVCIAQKFSDSDEQGVSGKSIVITVIAGLAMIGIYFLFRPFATLQYFIYWAIGSMIYFRDVSRICGRILYLLVVLSVMVLASYLFFGLPIELVTGRGLFSLPFVAVKAGVLVVLFLVVINSRFLLLKGFFVGLAKSSYTLYVCHFPLLCLSFSIFHVQFKKWDVGERGLFLFGIVIFLLGFSKLLARWLEERAVWAPVFQSCVRLGKRLVSS